MAARAIGCRVVAVSHAKDGRVYVFGKGRYVGDEVPKTAVGQVAEMAIEVGVTNPKIELDSGQVVWGCECWWGPEDAIERRFAGYEVVAVDIDERRAAYRAAAEGAR